MAKSIEIVVRADADQDDCLSAAAASYVEEHPELGGYDLAPRWQDEDDRTLVVLTIPAWAADERFGLVRLLQASGGFGEWQREPGKLSPEDLFADSADIDAGRWAPPGA